MFLNEYVSDSGSDREEVERLLFEVARSTCGEVIEDRAVGEERLREYLHERAVAALDAYVADACTATGLLRPAADNAALYWAPLSALRTRPTFSAYADLVARERFGFSRSAAEAATPGARVLAALTEAAASIKAQAKPGRATLGTEIQRAFRYRRLGQAARVLTSDAEVEMIVGGQYPYRVGELIDGASRSIQMAMFILSWGDDGHPARSLVEKLIAAHQRGVDVKVLLDRDRQTDLYGTRYINRPAADTLEAAGVGVRFDGSTELTHSKVLVFDGQRVVLGSHNWSRSSFFDYDEISVLVKSQAVAEDYARDLSRRFDKGTVPTRVMEPVVEDEPSPW